MSFSLTMTGLIPLQCQDVRQLTPALQCCGIISSSVGRFHARKLELSECVASSNSHSTPIGSWRFRPIPDSRSHRFHLIINWGCNYSRSGSRASKHLSNIMETDEHQIPFSRFFVELCLAQRLQFKILKFLFPNLNFPILETKLWIMI